MIKITKKALYTLVALFLLNSCYMDYVYLKSATALIR